ncbi:MAG: hypothetical protein ACJAUR_001913 [Ulvibacter sp.]|jgi:hypothetical protein
MNFPAIYSLVLGLSGSKLDVAFDARCVDYKMAEGFKEGVWAVI